MYNVSDVTKYIINYSEKYYGISNLKLQKILYFIQAHFLIKKKTPCFYEDIEAWNFGPVIPIIYEKYKQYGSANIPIIEKDNINISKKDKILINEIIDYFINYSATDLVYITKNQDPWKNIYNEDKTNKITLESIEKYFSE